MMFDSALARQQFTIQSSNTRTWQGRTWTTTSHNLDRIVVRDNVAYGVEIKNTQNYIDLDEFKIKLKLCDFLGLRPLFIFRFAPKSYIFEVNRHDGFVLLFEEQLYPWGHAALMREVRDELQPKVQSPRDIKERSSGSPCEVASKQALLGNLYSGANRNLQADEQLTISCV